MGEQSLMHLIQHMQPQLNEGEYVFVSLKDPSSISRDLPICEMKEKEGVTLILAREEAERLGLSFDYIASWITLNVHSDLEAVGLTAAFSSALAKHNISCNVVAGFYHDHLFVEKKNAQKAMQVLKTMTTSL